MRIDEDNWWEYLPGWVRILLGVVLSVFLGAFIGAAAFIFIIFLRLFL